MSGGADDLRRREPATGATEHLSTFVHSLQFDDIPSDVIEHAQRIVRNLVAASLWGWVSNGGPQVHATLEGIGGPPEATIFGGSGSLPVPHAAGVHAALAFSSKSDDTHGPAQLHPGHAAVPTVLAEGEHAGLSGRECVTALVAAIEAGVRIAASVGPAQDLEHNSMRMGFWSEVKCAIVAALASARATGLSLADYPHAVGIAATSSSGLLTSAGYGPPPHRSGAGSVYAWDAGKAVVMGVLARRLAGVGMTTGPAPLEGDRGWVRTYTGGYGQLDLLTEGLGDRWETAAVALKTHCMSHTIFPTVDAAGDLVNDHGVAPEDIERIVIKGPDYIGQNFWRTEVQTFEDAACSAPFAVAVSALEPSLTTLPDKVIRFLDDPRLHELLRKCSFEHDPTIVMNSGQLPGAVELHLTDGTVLGRRSAELARGSYPSSPLPEAEIDAKFDRAASRVLPPRRAKRALAMLHDLAELPDVAELCRGLRGGR